MDHDELQAQSYLKSYDKEAEEHQNELEAAKERNDKYIADNTVFLCHKCELTHDIYWCSKCGSLDLEETIL